MDRSQAGRTGKEFSPQSRRPQLVRLQPVPLGPLRRRSQTPDQKKRREKDIKEGKLPPEVFDKAFTETPKAYYVNLEKQLDASIANVTELGTICDEKFGSDAPSFGKLKASLEQVRHVAHALLTKKREIEPDPVVVEPTPETPEQTTAAEEGVPSAPGEARAPTA